MSLSTTHDLSPEAAVVLALARGETAAARQPVETARLVELAARHQVTGLCWWTLQEPAEASAPGLLPEDTRMELRLGYLHTSMRNEHLLTQIRELFTAFRERGVEALLLKGPWLAFHAYPDPGTRPMDDLDLAVREEDYREAVQCLRELGYGAAGPVPEAADRALRHAHHVRQLRFAAPRRRPVELHLRVINLGPPRDETWIRDTAITLTLGEATVRVPGPEAMLLHLTLHANQHGFAVLRLLHDVRWCLHASGNLDWELWLQRVRDLRCTASAYHTLALAAELAAARIPDEVLTALRPWPLRRRLFERVWRLDRVRRLEMHQRSNQLEAPRYYLLEVGSLAERTRYLRTLARESGGWRELLARARAARHR